MNCGVVVRLQEWRGCKGGETPLIVLSEILEGAEVGSCVPGLR